MIRVGDRIDFDGHAATVTAPFTYRQEQMMCSASDHAAGRLWTIRFDDGQVAAMACEHAMITLEDADGSH